MHSNWRPGRDVLGESLDESVHRETAYLLARWRFSISSKGCCWIRPAAATFSIEEIAGFVALFKRCCDSAFPRAVVFNWGRARLVGEQWTLAYGLLGDFATFLGACCRISCSRDGRTRAVIIARPGRSGGGAKGRRSNLQL